jgi:WD40 repeat protein
MAVAFAPEGTQVAIASTHGVQLWDLAGGQATSLEGPPSLVSSLLFSPDGGHIVALASDPDRGGTMLVWQRSGVLVKTVAAPGGGKFDGIAFSPDGTLIAAKHSSQLRFWQTATGAPADGMAVVEDVNAFAFSPDGSRILAGHTDNAARIVRLDGSEAIRLDGHTDGVSAVAYSPDGEHVATGGREAVVRVWSAKSGQLVATLEGHVERVVEIVFSPDGSRIASRSWDGTTRVWYMPRAMLREACDRVAPIPEHQRVAAVCEALE